MKGSEQRLVEYMDGAKKRFVIPVYQRNYDWKMENCKQLFDDLVKIIRNDRKSHFFGSIVSVYNPDGRNSEYLIIDGQQRLTTVSLLFLAMYNLIEKKVVTADDPSLSRQLYEDFLVDKYQPQETRIKLKPVKNDSTAFKKLFEEDDEHIQKSNLTINYNYFYDRIQRNEITVDELFDAICRLEIISIQLNQDDNPQLIFESLNSTGLALSEGDKIRNFILMGLPTKQQEDFYEKYWNRIEECTGYDVSAYIRDYLSVKQSAIPQINRVYHTFKAYVEDSKIDTESLLSDLLKYAKHYQTLCVGGTSSIALNSCIYRLNRLETAVTRPFFLEVLRMKSENALTSDEVTQIFRIVENYIFRRIVCDLPTNALNKIFLMLHKEIIRYEGSTEKYFEKFKYAMLSKKERVRFPADDEFIAAFSTKPMYLMNSKNKHYLFERLENYGTSEDKAVWDHIDRGEYTIEHIMPQHPTPSWISALGEDYANIHETWLHRIANLTLTAYNSKYSNSSFEEKRDMKNGFRDSGIRMNQRIAQKDSWGLPELEERNAELQYRALEIWSSPVSAYAAPETQMDSFTLGDDIEFTGKAIARFSYKNMEQPVTSWADMYQKILKILHSEDKSVLSGLAYTTDETVELSMHVSNKESDFSKCAEIDDGIFIWTNTNTQYKISTLRKFFTMYGADPEDLVFYMRDDDEEESAIAGTRYETRKKYWQFALPAIQSAHADTGCFGGCTGSKENWISGFFGVNGCGILCVANYDSARIDLYMGNNDVALNKRIFDTLFARRTEIEATLGVTLIWNRGDGQKSSKVSYEMKGIGITNESDWHRMSRFHAEWSKKIYDAVVDVIINTVQ